MPPDGDNSDGSRIGLYRRKLLAVMGASGIIGLAGCSNESNDTRTPTAAETPTDAETPTETATPSPSPTPTETPTPTPEPKEFGVSASLPGEITATTAELEGTLKGLGGADSAEVYFEYRPDGADEWMASEPQTFESPGTVSETIEGLTPRQDYDFRVVGETADGDVDESPPFSFTTLDAASIQDPSDVTGTSAVLHAEVNVGEVDSVQVAFEYKELLADSWERTDSAPPDDDGTVSHEVTGLSSRRLYSVRAVLTSDNFEATTGTAPFSTSSAGDGEDDTEYETASEHHPDHGFARFASWLDDDTPVITIREPTKEQLETALGVDHDRLIVFETSGTIDLEGGGISIHNGNFYIAGQTAPSPGITLVAGGVFNDSADDCVIQHVRIRRGDDTPESEDGDTLGNNEDVSDVVFDHVTASWGTDETLSSYGQNITISNCIVSEALRNSTFHEGGNGHSAGSLIGSGYEDIAMFGNVWASNLTRNPRLQSGSSVVVNNVSYDYRNAIGCSSQTRSSIVGNAFIRGDVNSSVITAMDASTGSIYVDDNYAYPEYNMVEEGINQADSEVNWPTGLEAFPSDDVLEHNVANAGARPADRTYHDRRIIHNVVNWEPVEGNLPGSSGLDHAWIDHEEIIGDYPELPVNTHELAVPDSGTRAWLSEWAMKVETPSVTPEDYLEEERPGVVDDFEDGDIDEYVDALVDWEEVEVAAATDHYAVNSDAPVATGEQSLKNTSGEIALISSHVDLPRYPRAGDTFSAKVATTETTPVMGIAFGVKSHENFYFVRYTEERGTLQFHSVTEDEWSTPEYEQLADTDAPGVETGAVYEIVVDWGTDGTIAVDLLDEAGEEIAALSVEDDTHLFGGFGTRRTGMLDDVQIQ